MCFSIKKIDFATCFFPSLCGGWRGKLRQQPCAAQLCMWFFSIFAALTSFLCGLTIRVCGRAARKTATPTHPFFLQSIAKKNSFLASDYVCKCRKHISYLQEKNAVFLFFFLIISKLHGQTRGHAPLLIAIGINFLRLRQCGVQCATY